MQCDAVRCSAMHLNDVQYNADLIKQISSIDQYQPSLDEEKTYKQQFYWSHNKISFFCGWFVWLLRASRMDLSTSLFCHFQLKEEGQEC